VGSSFFVLFFLSVHSLQQKYVYLSKSSRDNNKCINSIIYIDFTRKEKKSTVIRTGFYLSIHHLFLCLSVPYYY